MGEFIEYIQNGKPFFEMDIFPAPSPCDVAYLIT